jgi:L-seryl-tRNA(Ser) seleniumtransferase
VRTLGVKIIEVNSVDELQNAINNRTAMIEILGNYFGSEKFGLKHVAPIANKAGIPILIDAAADYLIVPNPYLAMGADLVAYSGGKIIRGPQTAGLLVGRKDLVKAAWANSAPHHAFGRALKVSKEEVVGMVRAVEVWRTQRDVTADFKEWESWYTYITEQITRVPGVKTQVRGPARGGPFPTLNVSWDPKQVGLTAGDVGRQLLDGEPRIMTHASGEGFSFALRPVALKPGEYKIVAQRLYEVLHSAPKLPEKPAIAPPAVDLSGGWEVEVHYEVGSARHKIFLTAKGNQIVGSHSGWTFQGDLKGKIDGDKVTLRSVLPAGGQHLNYTFQGQVAGDTMSGSVNLGEYGSARWSAKRHSGISA